MSVLAGQLSHQAAHTAFLAKGDEIFNRPPEGPWTMYSDVVPCDGQTLELDAIGPAPIVREMVGSRRFGSLRAYSKRTRVTPYSADALELSRLMVEKDRAGSLTKRLSDYLSIASSFLDKPVSDVFLANPIGIDGVALISASHPHGSGGAVWSNAAGAALSPSTYASGISAMSGLLLENGEPAGFYPTHLMVGPALEKMARDLTVNTMRVVPVSANGVEAYSTAVAATAIPNTWTEGSIAPIINKRMVGAYANGWVLMDLSKPGVRPMCVGEAMGARAIVVDDPQSEPMLQRSCYAYYAEGYYALSGYAPHCIYGTFTGS